MMKETKVCTKCGLEKSIEEFGKDKQKKTGFRPDCKVCNVNQCKKYAKSHRKEVNLNNLKYVTGISKKVYLAIKEEQKSLCAICGKPNVNPTRNLAVDHCHSSGFVRGLLCTKCNFGLGYFNDDSLLLDKAKEYLKTNLSSRKIPCKKYKDYGTKGGSHF